MKSASANENCSTFLGIVLALGLICTCMSTVSVAQQSGPKKVQVATPASTAGPRSFDTPQKAADVLADAAFCGVSKLRGPAVLAGVAT